jgi:hypothetical protein
LHTPSSDNSKDTGSFIKYKDYYQIRQRLTYGSLTDTRSGKKQFEDVDPALLETVRRLNVANSGLLDSHAIPA